MATTGGDKPRDYNGFENVIFQGNNRDILDNILDAFSLNHTDVGNKNNETIWTFVWNRREQLYKNVLAASAEKDKLRATLGKKYIVGSVRAKQIQEGDKTPNDKAAYKTNCEKLLKEVHFFFNQLKTTVAQITELKKEVGEVASAVPVVEPVVPPSAADTQVAAPVDIPAAPNAAEAAVTPPAADTQGAPASALQTIAAAASAPATAVTGDIAALTEELKKVNEELEMEKRKHEKLGIVCQDYEKVSKEHENTINELRGESDHQKIVIERHKTEYVTLEKDRDKYRSLCTRIEGIMKDYHDPSTTNDIADDVKIMRDAIEPFKQNTDKFKTFTKSIGDILTPARLDSNGNGRMEAIQKLVAFQNGVVKTLQCGTVEKVDESLDLLFQNEAELNAIHVIETNLLEKCGLSSLEDIGDHVESLDNELTAARETISILRGNAKLLTDIKKELGIVGQPTDEEVMQTFNNLKKYAEDTRVELQADKLENMKNKATEWRATVDSLHTENANLKASIADFTASSVASELDTIKQAKLNVETVLAGVQTELSTCKSELSTCKDNLHKCEQELRLIKPKLELYETNLNRERESYARLHDAHEILKGERTSSVPSSGSRTTTYELNERVSRLLDKLLRLAPSLSSDEIDVDTKVRKIADAILSTFNRGDQERAKTEVLKMLIQHFNLSDRSRHSLTERISRDLHALRGV